MTEPVFHDRPAPLDLAGLLALTGARAERSEAGALAITGVGALDWAGPSDLACAVTEDSAGALAASRAGACVVTPALVAWVPSGTAALVSDEPLAAFARAARGMFPAAARTGPLFGPGVAPGAVVHPDAKLEADVAVGPGAVVGPRAEMGRGAVIGANAVIGGDVRIGRGTVIGAGATVTDALVGDRVVIGPGARLGHAAPAGPLAPPSLGRVVVQDDVAIGANVSIARGGLHDTVIGEGTLVSDLASIGPDAMVGRGCVICALARVGAGAVLTDFFVLAVSPA